jgi:glucose-1-phosphate cytidylyltransferase
MQAIILAGGRGTRLSEETDLIPKPMIQISGKPMLWHIMNIFARQGIEHFLIATGYLSHVIDEWVDTLKTEWTIKTLYTGLETQTGGRIKRALQSSKSEKSFATYGDGLANVNLKALLQFHTEGGFTATLTAVRPPARFGVVDIDNGLVTHFGEKSQADSGWINGGFFVLDNRVADFVSDDTEPFEEGALPRLTTERALGGYQHDGFWKPMDTLREKRELETLARLPRVPWLE